MHIHVLMLFMHFVLLWYREKFMGKNFCVEIFCLLGYPTNFLTVNKYLVEVYHLFHLVVLCKQFMEACTHRLCISASFDRYIWRCLDLGGTQLKQAAVIPTI